MGNKQSFQLVYQNCPSCNSNEVLLLKSIKNLFLVVIDAILGFFLFSPLPYKLVCGKCGFIYKANIEKI